MRSPTTVVGDMKCQWGASRDLESEAGGRSSRQVEFLILAGFLIVVIYATWPLGLYASSRIPYSSIDPYLNIWLYTWAAHAIVHSPWNLFDANMFFPEQLTLAFTENDLGQSLPVAPVYWLTGNGVLTVNVALILMYTASAFGTYLLARELGASRPAAVLGGAIYGLAPYRVSQMVHVHVVAMHMAPFVLLFLVRLRSRPGRFGIWAVGLALAAQFWSSLSGGVITLFAVAGWGLWDLVAHRRAAIPILVTGAKGVLLAGVLVLPLAVPYVQAKHDHPEYTHAQEEIYTYSATLRSYVSPASGGPAVSDSYEWLGRQTEPEPGAWEKHLFPGWVLCTVITGIAGATMVRLITRRRPGEGSWLRPAGLGVAVAGVGFVLSLGPRFGARPDGFPLPFELISRATPLLRVPARFGTLVPLGLAIVVAVALTHAGSPRRRAILAGGIGVALLVELMPPYVTMLPTREINAAHRSVMSNPGAVLGLPTVEVKEDGSVVGHVEREPIHAYLSTAHWRPMVNGYSAFQPKSWWEMVHAVQDFPSPSSLSFLHERGVTTVVIETDMAAGTAWEAVADELATLPGARLMASSGPTRVYDITGARSGSAQ